MAHCCQEFPRSAAVTEIICSKIAPFRAAENPRFLRHFVSPSHQELTLSLCLNASPMLPISALQSQLPALSSQQNSGDFHAFHTRTFPRCPSCSLSQLCPLSPHYPHTQLPKELRSVCLKGFQALRGAHPSAGDLAAFLGLSVPKNKQLQRHHPLPGIGEEHTWLQPIAEKQPSSRTAALEPAVLSSGAAAEPNRSPVVLFCPLLVPWSSQDHHPHPQGMLRAVSVTRTLDVCP